MSANAKGAAWEAAAFFALAFVVTSALDAPRALSLFRGEPVSFSASALRDLGGVVPSLVALAMAWAVGTLGEFRWRTHPGWIVAALGATLAMHTLANAAALAFGGPQSHWFHVPTQPRQYATMVLFPLGEELGWRGFAYPRLARAHGPLVAALVVGVVWGLWHVGSMFTPRGAPELGTIGLAVAGFTLQSVVIAWLFERSGSSVLVAIAFQAGGYLDNVNAGAPGALRVRALRFAILFVAAALAARSLGRPATAAPQPRSAS